MFHTNCGGRWDDLIYRLRNCGYSGLAIEYDELCKNSLDVEKQVTEIRNLVSAAKMTPPILIAHSLGCYLGLKYLESHALSAIIMLNPRVNTKDSVIIRNDKIESICAGYRSDIPSKYLSLAPKSILAVLEPPEIEPSNIYIPLLDHKPSNLLFYLIGPTPISVIYCRGDESNKDDISRLIEDHCVLAGDIHVLEDVDNRIPMIHNSSSICERIISILDET